MRRITILLSALACTAFALGAQTPVISGLQAVNITTSPSSQLPHSVVELQWNTSPLWSNSGCPNNGDCVDIVVVPGASASCSDASVPTGAWVFPDDAFPTVSPVNVNVSGLTPGTQYNLCPRVWTGSAYVSGAQLNITTPALPAVHPVPPVPALTYDTSYPDTTSVTATTASTTNGSTSITVATSTGISVGQIVTATGVPDNTKVAAVSGATVTLSNAATATGTNVPVKFGYVVLPVDYTCNVTTAGGPTVTTGWLAQLTYAMNHQDTTDFMIEIPAGSVCVPPNNLPYFFPSVLPKDVISLTTANVIASGVNSKISLTNCCGNGNTFTEGSLVTFGANGYSSAVPGQTSCPGGNGYVPIGVPYYVHVLDSNDFSVYCNGSQAQGGTLMQFTNSGTGTIWIYPYPRKGLHNIIIRTNTPDSQFVPAGVRVSPSWSSKMATFQLPYSMIGYGPGSMGLLYLTGQDSYSTLPYAKIRFMGIEFTEEDNPELHQTTDPNGYSLILDTGTNGADDRAKSTMLQDVTIDRCYFHMLPPPGRTGVGIFWNGYNVTMRDSYFDNIQFWHGTNLSGYGPTSYPYNAYPYTATSISGNTLTLGPIDQGMNGTVHVKTATNSTITVSGTASGSVFVFADLGGNVNVSLPPGETGTCSIPNCQIYAGDSIGGGVQHDGSAGFPSTNTSGNSFYVDPIWSSSSSCTSTESIFASMNGGMFGTVPGSNTYSDATVREVGTRFGVSGSGYICGVRFFKPSASNQSAHTIDLWNSSGTNLFTMTTSGETASGWQTATFASPVAVSPGTYVASYVTPANDTIYLHTGLWENLQSGSAHVYGLAKYTADNGNGCKINNAFPVDYTGRISVGVIACATITSGSFTAASAANGDTGYNGDPETGSGVYNEGSNFIQSGTGPGPYQFINNYFTGAAGIYIHHDDGGGIKSPRGDYTYYRNDFHMEFSKMWGAPTSDGLRYNSRQSIEWKQGQRIHIDGNIFDGFWYEDNPDGEAICLTNRNLPGANDRGWPITDVNVEYNIVEHGPGFMFGPGTVYGGDGFEVPDPPVRSSFKNNVIWDMAEYVYQVPLKGFGPGIGSVLQGNDGTEDMVFDHNTIVQQTGGVASMIYQGSAHVEGVHLTNNILNINGPSTFNYSSGFVYTTADSPASVSTFNAQCDASVPSTNGPGEAAMACVYPNLVFSHNLLLPTQSATQANVQSWYPQTHAGFTGNFISAATSTFSVVPFYKFDSTTLNQFDSGLMGNNFRIKSGSTYSSGSTSKALDGTDIGADWPTLEVHQGWVTLIGVPNSTVTSTSATVAFVAPDSQACPVDVSSTDPNVLTGFTRYSDTGTATRHRAVQMTGLATHTLYYGRVQCATQQPTFTFWTN